MAASSPFLESAFVGRYFFFFSAQGASPSTRVRCFEIPAPLMPPVQQPRPEIGSLLAGAGWTIQFRDHVDLCRETKDEKLRILGVPLRATSDLILQRPQRQPEQSPFNKTKSREKRSVQCCLIELAALPDTRRSLRVAMAVAHDSVSEFLQCLAI